MSTHYACRGGASYYGDRCGHLLVNHTAYSLATDWNTGAALSFNFLVHIILFVVADLEMVITVVLL